MAQRGALTLGLPTPEEILFSSRSLRKRPITQTKKALWLMESLGENWPPARSGCAPENWGAASRKSREEAVSKKVEKLQAKGGSTDSSVRATGSLVRPSSVGLNAVE